MNFNAEKFYNGEPLERLNCLNNAAEYIQSGKELQTRFMGLSRRLKSAYTICFPSGELTDEETAKAQFYLAIRSIIYKQTKGDAPDAETMNRVVEDIKNQLNMDLTVLLYQNGYPPEWDEEVFEKVMEQAENFKKYSS